MFVYVDDKVISVYSALDQNVISLHICLRSKFDYLTFKLGSKHSICSYSDTFLSLTRMHQKIL